MLIFLIIIRDFIQKLVQYLLTMNHQNIHHRYIYEAELMFFMELWALLDDRLTLRLGDLWLLQNSDSLQNPVFNVLAHHTF
jgi:hypothetical protein